MHACVLEVETCGSSFIVHAAACDSVVKKAKKPKLSKRLAEEEIIDCNACISAHLSGGVHPSGATSSSGILRTPQPIIKRGDQMFFRLATKPL